MPLSVRQISSLIEEFRALLTHSAVRKVLCVDEATFVLELRAPGRNFYLLLSLQEGLVRTHLMDGKPTQTPEPTPFVMTLRKHLVGTRIAAIDQIENDRVFSIVFKRLALKGRDHLALMAELASRRGNIFLLDRDSKILGSLFRNRSHRRDLVAGRPYISPTPPSPDLLDRLSKDDLGLSAQPPDGSRSRSLAGFYKQRRARLVQDRVSRETTRRLQRQLKTLRKREAAVAADLNRALEAERYRKWGELLQSAYGKVERGAESVDVPDFYAEGSPEVSIPLDPRLDLKANINRYFQRYKKFHGARKHIEERLKRARATIETLDKASEKAKHIVTSENLQPEDCVSQLQEIVAALETDKVLPKKRRQAQQAGAATQPKALPYRRFESKTGKTVLVGKGGKDNDTLTLKVARGNDLWLHTADWAGAHVVVRLARNEEIDQESLLDAATLAGFYSKARKATTVEVSYTRAKYVRKPKGFPPGKVTLAQGKTLTVRIEEERLDRLLGRK